MAQDLPRIRLDEISERLEIEYPCTWLYKVIGTSAPALHQAVLEVIEGDAYTVELSNTSSGGRYVSLNIGVYVRTDTQRTGIYESLRAHRDVRMVL